MLPCLLQLSGEAVADWIKHAFIAKFNSLEPHVYADMERVLRKDIINLFNEDEDNDKVVFDHNYAITRRVGLSQVNFHNFSLLTSPLTVISIHNFIFIYYCF